MPPRITLLGLIGDKRAILPRRIVQYHCENAPTKVKSAGYATASTYQNDPEARLEDRPRWQQTPSRMTAPVRMRQYKPKNEYRVNEDPRQLDQVYVQVLGPDGDKVLSDEVKWLAVTHKSFDQGRRGYNDRLAFFGKRIVDLQSSLAILSSHAATGSPAPPPDSFEREQYQHPALDSIPQLTEEVRKDITSRKRISDIAQRYGLLSVLRWKPKKASDLPGSGLELALAQALYAIVGAVSLQKGGEVANKVVRERILSQLGLS
ncbi:hypothetical protein MMC26_004803 [Xylographa opegraphella]|nr:hypothetical protein [Xylographa opegraphella]